MWQTFLALAYKEILHATRNKTGLKMLFFFQILSFCMLAFMDFNVKNLPTVIVDQDRTTESRDLIGRIAATGTFNLKYITSSVDQARTHIRAGRARVAVVIPPDYSRLRAQGEEAQVLALLDGSDGSSSGEAMAALEGLTARISQEAREAHPGATATATVSAHPVRLYNPEGSASNFMLPGLLAMLLGGAYSMRSMGSLAHERDAGNLERLLMTPMSYAGLILGKLVPWFVLAFLNGLAYIVVIRYAFKVPVRGDVLLLVGVTGLYVLTLVALGTYFAASTKTGGDAGGKWHITLFPATMLSGYLFPIASLPKWLLPISYALPHTHFIALMRGICMRGATATELAPHVAYLVIAPIALILISARQFKNTAMQ
jgi:ABC-2 type transport system permease protein